jgi:hypothetical protein
VLYHLLWCHVLTTDLAAAPLSPGSVVGQTVEAAQAWEHSGYGNYHLSLYGFEDNSRVKHVMSNMRASSPTS